jgi:hypothetical protein
MIEKKKRWMETIPKRSLSSQALLKELFSVEIMTKI